MLPLERTQPLYPGKHLDAGDEGWVQLNVVIRRDGSVGDPIVEYATSPLFASSAVDCVQEWQYGPGRYERTLSLVLAFAVDSSARPARAAFRRAYERTARTIEGENLELAARDVAGLVGLPGLRLRERAYTYVLDADLRARTGERDRALWSLSRAAGAPADLDADVRQRAEQTLVSLQLELQQLQPALERYDRLLRDRVPLPDSLVASAAQARERIASGTPLARAGRIATASEIDAGEAPPVWMHALLRPELSFEDVKGRLDSIDFRCGRHRALERVGDQSTWMIPAHWGECSVYVYGEPGTTFNLVER